MSPDTDRRVVIKLTLLTAFLWLTAVSSSAQTPKTPHATNQAGDPLTTPWTLIECEGLDNCTSWTFLGVQGVGQWRTGEIASLLIESISPDKITIRRADSSGSKAGYTAEYTGRRSADRIGGEFTSSWPGHENPTGNWYAFLSQPTSGLPPTIRVCDPQVQCDTWTLNGNGYETRMGNVTATMTVLSFTPSSFVIRRVDHQSRAGYSYTYRGSVSEQGTSVLDGQWTGDSHSRQAGASGRFTAVWGEALNDSSSSPQASSWTPAQIISAGKVAWNILAVMDRLSTWYSDR